MPQLKNKNSHKNNHPPPILKQRTYCPHIGWGTYLPTKGKIKVKHVTGLTHTFCLESKENTLPKITFKTYKVSTTYPVFLQSGKGCCGK